MRRLLCPLLAGLMGVASWEVDHRVASGQERGANPPAPTAERPDGEPLRIENVPPELMLHLKHWERASAKIEKLQGRHRRFVYDLVFEVEKRSDGLFYYEAPDKGRIDITPGKIEKGDKSKRESAKTKQPFKLEADRSERWVCTGQEVLQINDSEKSYEMYHIPPQHQGANIMEGPLPFLFGMPADKAIRRFHLTLLRQTETAVTISARPRWQSDAQNYREAKIMLDISEGRYLPSAVQLIDPSGNLETVYTFLELQVNKKPIFPALWGGNPFQPNLKSYRLIVNEPTIAGPPNGTPPRNPNDPRAPERVAANPVSNPAAPRANPLANPNFPPRPETVPSVVGLDWEDATKVLKELGCTVKYVEGEVATEEKLVFRVYEQQPKPRTPLSSGQVVYLRLYAKAKVAGGDAPPKR